MTGPKRTRNFVIILAQFPDFPVPENWAHSVQDRILNLIAYTKIVYGKEDVDFTLTGPYTLKPRAWFSHLSLAMIDTIKSAQSDLVNQEFAFVIFNEPGSGGEGFRAHFPCDYFYSGSKIVSASYMRLNAPLHALGVDTVHFLSQFEESPQTLYSRNAGIPVG